MTWSDSPQIKAQIEGRTIEKRPKDEEWFGIMYIWNGSVGSIDWRFSLFFLIIFFSWQSLSEERFPFQRASKRAKSHSASTTTGNKQRRNEKENETTKKHEEVSIHESSSSLSLLLSLSSAASYKAFQTWQVCFLKLGGRVQLGPRGIEVSLKEQHSPFTPSQIKLTFN